MRNPGGYGQIFGDWRETEEHDTFTCFHCNKIVIVKVKCAPEDLGGLCKQCMKLICSACVNKGNCDPLEKKLEREEARYHALKSYGLI